MTDQRLDAALAERGIARSRTHAARLIADGSVTTVTVGKSVVSLDASTVRVVKKGSRPIDLLRAATTLIWGSGLPIYGLDVPAELYTESTV